MKQASSIEEIAERYGLGRSTIYEEISRGNLTVRKIGKRSIILAKDEQQWLDNLKTGLAHAVAHTRKVDARKHRRTTARTNGRQSR